MGEELEIIQHSLLDCLSMFVVAMEYRTTHFHRDFELDLVLSGDIVVCLPGSAVHVETGQLLLLNPNEPHELHAMGKAEMLCLQLSPRFLRRSFPDMAQLSFDIPCISGDAAPGLGAALIELGWQIYADKPLKPLACGGVLELMMWRLLRDVPYHFLTEEEKLSVHRRARRLESILAYIDENYTRRILLSDIAEREQLSLSYLSHFFRENLNQTFQEYVTGLRVNRAREILSGSSLSLLDICMESGFSDPRYLSRAFLRQEGCTPTEYRVRASQKLPGALRRSSHSAQYFPTAEECRALLRPLRPGAETLTALWLEMLAVSEQTPHAAPETRP